MNLEDTKISGMISVCSGNNGNARLDYEIDLKADAVLYVLRVFRRDRTNDPEAVTRWGKYADAKAAYETACDIVETGKCDRVAARKEATA